MRLEDAGNSILVPVRNSPTVCFKYDTAISVSESVSVSNAFGLSTRFAKDVPGKKTGAGEFASLSLLSMELGWKS